MYMVVLTSSDEMTNQPNQMNEILFEVTMTNDLMSHKQQATWRRQPPGGSMAKGSASEMSGFTVIKVASMEEAMKIA